MELKLDEAIALLSRTPVVLDSLLRGMPDVWTKQNEGGKTWNPFDVVGHLIHGEKTDWIVRARIILESGESRAFDKFDRLAQERDPKDKTLAERLEEFGKLRAKNLGDLRGLKLTPELLAKRGKHPELGVVTLSQLLATWVVHDLTHLHQISRVMAHQYDETVGPWRVYLGVLNCEGHSE